ncbi:MAG: T9SS type A sorting domain-containing protein [Chitinophagales bacterium]|nr:T9SS type A sorting domain-containing protein [Chitinophagales bacterium]
MHKLIVLFCILAASTWAKAQEALLPLPVNSRLQMAAERGFQQDFSALCSEQTYITITNMVQPECGLSTGSFTATLDVLTPSDYSIVIKYRNTSGVVTTADPSSSSGNTFTFSDLRANVYFLIVTHNISGKTTIQTVEVHNIEAPNMLASDWDIFPVNCALKGKVIRSSVGQIAANLRLYSLNPTADQTAFLASGNDIGTSDLEAGYYYIEAKALNADCRKYYALIIEEEPTISVPFVEDFSTSLVRPNANYWQEDLAYINDDFPTNSISLGVATLDGFNQFGQPYQAVGIGTGIINGEADVLTSQPVCLISSGITPGDKLYLSFFYEAQGWGDFPNQFDSLMVDFLGNDGVWYNKWKIPGPNVDNPNNTFTFVQLEENDVKFLYEGFQFRFRNKASISGYNDHWHVDYVRLTDSPANDTPKDAAFATEPKSMLTQYTAIPWKHFKNHYTEQIATAAEMPITINNLYNLSPLNRSLEHTISDACTKEPIYFYNAGIADGFGDLPPQGGFTSSIVFKSDEIKEDLGEYIANIDPNQDKVVLENKWEIVINDASDVETTLDNNVVYQYQKFYNTYGYDDETAEKAYGLYGIGSKLAYRYVTLEPDTLRAIQINFLNMNAAIENLPIRLKVWKRVNQGTNKDSLLYSSPDFDTPHFLDYSNGMWTYLLTHPIVVTDTFYIGFEQADVNLIAIGFDRTNASFGEGLDYNDKIYYNTSAVWYPSLFAGALLMRPVMGKALEGDLNVGVQPPHSPMQPTEVSVYPNPATDQLYIRHTLFNQNNAKAICYDLLGRTVASYPLTSQPIDIASLPDGIYFLRLYDANQQAFGSAKFIKQ